jgi:hypothetical protein
MLLKRPIVERNVPHYSIFLNSQKMCPIYSVSYNSGSVSIWNTEINGMSFKVRSETYQSGDILITVEGETLYFKYHIRPEYRRREGADIIQGWYRLFHKQQAEDAIYLLLLLA